LPFTVEQFHGVFVAYNEAVWPMQLLLIAVAVLSLLLIVIGGAANRRAVSIVLALFWVWTATTYHIAFARISPSGWLFAVLSLAGGLWFGWVGGWQNRIAFGVRADLRSIIAGVLILYALVLYPLLGFAFGHRYPALPTFGAPCPVTIFTIGALLLTVAPPPRSVFVVPVLWALFAGTSATFMLGVYQDAGLLIAGIIGLAAMIAPARPNGITGPAAVHAPH
jgi:hypothetical protein